MEGVGAQEKERRGAAVQEIESTPWERQTVKREEQMCADAQVEKTPHKDDNP